MNRRLLAVPALGALLGFGAVACGSDNTAQLDTWAKNLCGAAQDPIAQSRTALADTSKVTPGESPADLQKRLAADLGMLAQANQQLADAIDKAGAPKVDQGAKLQQDAGDELKQVAQGYLDVQKKLTALPTGDQAKFADGLRSIGDQVQRLAQQSTDGLNKIQSGDLGTAIGKQPGCKSGAGATATGTGGTGGTSGAPSPSAPVSPSASASAPAASASPSPSASKS